VYEWVEGPDTLTTRWRFSCLLDLPWRPRLAAAGGTTHVMDLQRGCVVRHDERCVAAGRAEARECAGGDARGLPRVRGVLRRWLGRGRERGSALRRWEVEPGKVVAQLLQPAAKVGGAGGGEQQGGGKRLRGVCVRLGGEGAAAAARRVWPA
jgi:hypothetical protein